MNITLFLCFISAAMIPRPGGIKDAADGNAMYLLAALCLMDTEAGVVNGTKVLLGRILTQMFAGVTVKSAAAGSAAAALRFPLFFVLLLPFEIGGFLVHVTLSRGGQGRRRPRA